MLNRYMSFFLLLSVYAGMQCAQPQAKPFLTPEQAAISMNPMTYGTQENWDTFAAGIAGNLFKRYPDITRKELVGFFRWADEQGRERACVLPLPILKKIWKHIEDFKFINKFQYDIKRVSTKFDGPRLITPFHNGIYYNLHRRIWLCWIQGHPLWEWHVAYEWPINHFLVSVARSMDEDRIRYSGNTVLSEEHSLHEVHLYYAQDYAHVLLADKEKVLVVPHVPYRHGTTGSQELTTSMLQAYKNNRAQYFANYVDAFAYLRTLEEQQPQH